MRRKVEICCAYKGVGNVTATQLLAHIPELGKLSKNEIVSLAGCAPFARDSGTIKGYMSTKGNGRQPVKRALFLACLSAIRFNKTIRKFFEKLVNSGKKKMVAMVACMRKMIVHLNVMLKAYFNANVVY